MQHDKPGIVGMANNGANSNNSQFYITTVPCTHLDNRNVAFGIVKKGFNIAVEMADIPRTDDRPLEVGYFIKFSIHGLFIELSV